MGPFIVHTGPRRQGAVQYVTRMDSPGRRIEFKLDGYRDRAFLFEDVESAELAVYHFSSAYELEVTEI